MSQARMAVANMAGSAPSIWKKGLTRGVRTSPIMGASRIIPTMGMHMGPMASRPLSSSAPRPNRLPRQRSMAAMTIKTTMTSTMI